MKNGKIVLNFLNTKSTVNSLKLCQYCVLWQKVHGVTNLSKLREHLAVQLRNFLVGLFDKTTAVLKTNAMYRQQEIRSMERVSAQCFHPINANSGLLLLQPFLRYTGSQNLKIDYVTPAMTPTDLICMFFI